MATNGAANRAAETSASATSTQLDERLEALIEEGGPNRSQAGPLTGTSDGPERSATTEDLLTDVVAELRGMREAFLSLPSLDELDARLAAIERGVGRLAAALEQVLGRLAAAETAFGEQRQDPSSQARTPTSSGSPARSVRDLTGAPAVEGEHPDR